MIGGFRKKGKRGNIRKKVFGSDEEEEGEETNTESAIIKHVASAPVIAAKTKIKKSASTLSFNDEFQQEEEFVIKRSKASLNMQDEVKKEKKHKKKKGDGKDNKKDENYSPAVQSSDLDIKTFDDDEELDDNDATRRFSTSHRFSTPGDIPDAATIYAMKKKREQARQFGGQVNYIPLNTIKYESRFSTAQSRLIREENDSSDDERLEMKGNTTSSHPALERRKQVAKALEEAHDESDEEHKEHDDEEFQRWEEEQIKKGSQIITQQPEPYGPKIPSTNGAQSIDNYSNSMLPQQTFQIPGGYPMQIFPTAYTIPVADSQVFDVDIIAKRLSEQLDTKKQLHRLHTQQREKNKFDLDSSKENIVTLERKAGDVSDRFSFYQEMQGFVKDLIECLNEKVKKINELEDSMHQVLKKTSQKFMTRRQNDVKDEADEASTKTMTNDSDRINNAKNRRIAEREGRRNRRREKRMDSAESAHYEGMSSDDEMLTSDSLRFEAEKAKILTEVDSLFEDVINDFTSIPEIRSRFEQWKFGFNETYKEAYLGLCLPKLFTPFIKLQLLNWNPLELEGTADFEEMEWFLSLAAYGDLGGEPDPEDEDVKLLPNIIEKVLIPKITVLMRDVWDPLSTKQTKLATFLLQRLIDDIPTITRDSKQTKELVDVIVLKLKDAVETDMFIPLYPHTMLEIKNSKALSFLERQFWKGVKLLSNLMEWNWLLSQKKLQQLGIDAILNRYLIIALQQFPDATSSLEKAKMIINVLPKEWFEKSDKIVPGLESFARYLNGLAATVYKSSLGYTDEVNKKKMKVTIKKIISLLMHIQAFDEARSIATSYKEELRKDESRSSPFVSQSNSPS